PRRQSRNTMRPGSRRARLSRRETLCLSLSFTGVPGGSEAHRVSNGDRESHAAESRVAGAKVSPGLPGRASPYAPRVAAAGASELGAGCRAPGLAGLVGGEVVEQPVGDGAGGTGK